MELLFYDMCLCVRCLRSQPKSYPHEHIPRPSSCLAKRATAAAAIALAEGATDRGPAKFNGEDTNDDLAGCRTFISMSSAEVGGCESWVCRGWFPSNGILEKTLCILGGQTTLPDKAHSPRCVNRWLRISVSGDHGSSLGQNHDLFEISDFRPPNRSTTYNSTV